MPYQDAVQSWLRFPDLSPEDRTLLKSWLKDSAALESAFGERLSFGTAGLRGRMGPGPGLMNRQTIAWTTAGLAESLLAAGHSEGKVVIARDSRHHSDLFAQVAAEVLAGFGYMPLYWKAPTPTPALSWAVRKYKALAGIVITASHNPSAYNGYKVYNAEGGQILAESADRISQALDRYLRGETKLSNLDPFSELLRVGRIQLLGGNVLEAYLEEVSRQAAGLSDGNDTPVKVVYSPLHGTGSPAIPKLLRSAGFDIVEVPEQSKPDGDFPTLEKPNPEDPAAFALAEALGRATKADLLLLTDPDADRLGAAVAEEDGYRFFSGNQLAALMLDFLTERLKPKEGLVLTSVVSSPFPKILAKNQGLKVIETLTGFKYIAEHMSYPQAADPPFFFGFEESYGFLFGDHVRDKDAIMAALVMAFCLRAAKAKGQSLGERLNELYSLTGFYEDRLVNMNLNDLGGRQAGLDFLDKLRQEPPLEIAGNSVLEMRDYAQGIDALPQENMLQFFLEDGSVLALRPSGTEPLLKFYMNICGKNAARAKKATDAYASAFAKRIGQA